MNIGNFNSSYFCINNKISKIMNKCKKPSRETASKAGKLLRKKISSKDVKTLAGYTLQAASRRGKSKSGCQKKGK